MIVVGGILSCMLFRPFEQDLIRVEVSYNMLTFYMELDTTSEVDMLNQPKPTHYHQEAESDVERCVFLPMLQHHADCRVSQLHSQ
jgi:hypothetical protein